ncbi:MAG TPA: mechanosensitive ion channel family protein [Vicinamibacterales bacterium]|nr:mechanosensitive ion channel family protein [Vicinamibacterales bacterium]
MNSRARAVAVFCLVGCACSVLAAQSPAPPRSLTATISSDRDAEPVTLTFFNRPIVTLRARILGRRPADRVAGAHQILEDLSHSGVTGPVLTEAVDGGVFITVGSVGVMGLSAVDVDELAGETLPVVTARTVANLQQALNEAHEARAPRMLVRASIAGLLAIALAGAVLWAVGRARRVVAAKFIELAERRVTGAGIAPLEALRASRVLDAQRHIVTASIALVDLIVIYSALTFTLRQFPYTRPWGESMSGFLLATVENLGLSVVNALPGLFTVLLIFTTVRFLVRLVRLWFDSVERGRVRPRWIYPDTAAPTRRLVTSLLWLLAIVVAYPYMPGSQTEAFKGVSVFLGLIVTFGSSGLVNQIMSGFMITYSRALRIGDFVKTGDVEGTVLHLGVLSTKVRTLMNEEVTIPNAVIVAQTTTDYSRSSATAPVYTPTSVTIGYDTPWRQVHALLLQAAARTPDLRTDPKPMVVQASLEDFYVKYTLLVSLERQESRLFALDVLHANIQDTFNEHGVQIMSPNYMLDPAAPKVVPKERWFAAPAAADPMWTAPHDIGTIHSTGSSSPALSGRRPAE